MTGEAPAADDGFLRFARNRRVPRAARYDGALAGLALRALDAPRGRDDAMETTENGNERSDEPPRWGPRSELKFLLDEAEARRFVSRLRDTLDPDPHACDPEDPTYTVDSLYLETPERSSLTAEGFPKYRLRRYDDAPGSLHAEEKLSHAPLVWKRRIACAAPTGALWNGVALEDPALAWYRRRVRRLRLAPAMRIAYRRAAWRGPDGLRVTLDTEVRAATSVRPDFDGALAWMALDCRPVLEFKFAGTAGPALERALAELPEPVRFSKFRLGAERLGLVGSTHEVPS